MENPPATSAPTGRRGGRSGKTRGRGGSGNITSTPNTSVHPDPSLALLPLSLGRTPRTTPGTSVSYSRQRGGHGQRQAGTNSHGGATTPHSQPGSDPSLALGQQAVAFAHNESMDPAGPRVSGSQRGRGSRRTIANAPSLQATPFPALGHQVMDSVPSEVTGSSTLPNLNNRGRRGGRRGGATRGGRGGGAQQMVNGRLFGGQLTAPAGGLTANAPEFVPGQPIAHRARQNEVSRRPHKSKSLAQDIATRTHEDITNGHYECVICTEVVRPRSKIWNCKTCWSVLHLVCVDKWASGEVATVQQRAAENGELPPLRQWRCPACNLPKHELPKTYTCWCEKEIDPRSEGGLPPHSCGNTCSKQRAGQCPHPCESVCHAGPCKPCEHMAPPAPCFCGKENSAMRCKDTNYESGWSCGQVCGDVLPCGEHYCERSCHEGVCGSCEVPIESRCYCGRSEKPLACSEREEEKESYAFVKNVEESNEAKEVEVWTGSFNCGTECRRPYDCGIPEHYCSDDCHPQDAMPAHCPFSPDVVTNCPCGKTNLEKLLPQPRSSCSDKIPYCSKKCERTLQCGHLHQQTCHDGDCGSCLETVQISCRCGRTSSNTVCHQGSNEPPSCARSCRATLNCGRHECGERCCPGEKKASERTQAAKRRYRGLAAPVADENIEAEHICLRVCGKTLPCGGHQCEELCHRGPCHRCLEAIFDEIHCACGRTTLYPPQPCGTTAPDCRFDCTRQKACGHPQIKHNCHQDGESCPSCPYLVEKLCMCRKRTLKNQPCWLERVTCGLPCGKKLKCGIHTCAKSCHASGDCEDATSKCTQPCGRKKTVCDHVDTSPCHTPYPCKESSPCQAKTFITCDCQHQKQAVKCLASSSSEGNSQKTLECNDECLKLQRNAKLAAALNIDPATHTDDHIPYSQKTLDMYKENSGKFCQTYEREFRVFAADASEKRLRFKPMQASQRAFLHSLAEDFGLDSESQDPEPHRHVSIFKTPRFVSAPLKTLGQCIKLRPVVAEASAPPAKGLMATAEPFNAFLLSNPKFGLTINELQSSLSPELSTGGLDFEISFLPSGDTVLRAKAQAAITIKIDSALQAMKTAVTKRIKLLDLASSVVLCAVDANFNVLRQEDDGASGGWSQVAKGAPLRNGSSGVGLGVKSSFTVLGRNKEKEREMEKEKEERKREKQLKKKLEGEGEAIDDWETEVAGWEDG